MFEYAIGHWLQKSTEHIMGCVLCSPGCFSLFRGKALMDQNIAKTYTTVSTEPRHFIQVRRNIENSTFRLLNTVKLLYDDHL
jgi:chitin synthase